MMRARFDNFDVDVAVGFDVRWKADLEPGAWIVQSRGQEMSVTNLQGTFLEGQFHVAYPKGVARKAGGGWSAQERLLVDVLPLHPLKAWQAIPEAIRSVLEDAYLLSRDELPDRLGRP